MLGIQLHSETLKRVKTEAERILGSPEAADEWLSEPSSGWPSPPCFYLTSEKSAERVMHALWRLEYGTYS